MGVLFIVATAIGNLKDITLRALEILKEVDMVLCEDTRQTVKLLSHYGISKPLVSYFQHSRISKIDYIIEQLEKGKNIALVTDAGTPGISDPAGKLIEAVVNRLPSCRIAPIPGPSALTAALSISNFSTDKFIFMGFPPAKKGREKFFKKLAEAEYPVVLYESVHRILKTLSQIDKAVNMVNQAKKLKADLLVCRELTKRFETIYRGAPEEVIKIIQSTKNNLKGEFVIVVRKNITVH